MVPAFALELLRAFSRWEEYHEIRPALLRSC